MSRAFVNEDAGAAPERYPLPAARRSRPFPSPPRGRCFAAPTRATPPGAEAATGYYFGDPTLRREVEQFLAEARESGNERVEQLAERFLRRISGRGRA